MRHFSAVSVHKRNNYRDGGLSISIVSRMFVFPLLVVLNDLSGVALDTGMVRREMITVAAATFG